MHTPGAGGAADSSSSTTGDYGVVASGSTQEPIIDAEATARRRHEMRAVRGEEPFFDRGPGYARLAQGRTSAECDWL